MKTSLDLCMFAVVATMIAIACSGPDETDEPQRRVPQGPPPTVPPPTVPSPHVPSPSPIATHAFFTYVTTWVRTDSSHFIGLVSTVPYTTQPWINFYGIYKDQLICIDNDFVISKETNCQPTYEGHFWVTPQSNVLLINYEAATPDSVPPFPLQIVIEY